jgi:hypothetical protein
VTELTTEITAEKIAELLRDLPAADRKAVLARVAERLEAQEWMRLAESGLREWLNEPDLYADDR